MEEVRSTPPLQDGNDVFDMNLSQNKGIYLINELLVTDSNSMGDDYLTGSLEKPDIIIYLDSTVYKSCNCMLKSQKELLPRFNVPTRGG